jgi:ABC-type branched-subunit amino acid transport system substrate-binding protein
LLAGFLLASGCGSDGNGGSDGGGDSVPVVVSAPISSKPWIGGFIRQGAQLAVDEINRHGGVPVGGARRTLRLHVLNADTPSQSAANARVAVAEHAAMLLTDGTGAEAIAGVTDPVHLPVFVCFDGGDSLIDPARWPTLFRMAPQNKPMARRLADYVANARPRLAILTDDSSYGMQGRQALRQAFAVDDVPVVSDTTAPAEAADLSAQVLAARRAGADRLVVWASATDVAATVRAARSAGWNAPIYTGPTGEDPLVRQQLAAHPEWLDGVHFVSFRITSEVGPAPFEAFRGAFEAAFGPQRVGVSQDGKPVVQPPDWPMFGYDAVRLTAKALEQSRALGAPLLDALTTVAIVGANGDDRGYGPTQHEGVNPSDMYFARFVGFTFRPVTDDPLSGDLPVVNQLSG